jgi:hypothetical protein
MNLYFPGLAKLCREVDEDWHLKGEIKPRMEFGHFYSMAINVDIPGRPVKSIPHRDLMNLAWGVCIIMAWGVFYPFTSTVFTPDVYHINIGFFPDGTLAWLVNHEAQIIIQIPTAVFYFCLSSIITHYNVDLNGGFIDDQLSSQ